MARYPWSPPIFDANYTVKLRKDCRMARSPLPCFQRIAPTPVYRPQDAGTMSLSWAECKRYQTMCYIYIYIWCYVYIYIYIPVVPRKAVAEVSRIGHYRRGELLWCMVDRANPLMDRKVVGIVFLWVIAMVAVATSLTTPGCSVV